VSAPLVSVAIANFNGARFLEDAIASALRQDLRELEVIVVDDGSDDDSADRAERMARRDGRLRVERLGHRHGPGAARNRALDLARGEWLAVLDGDDLMHPGRLAQLVARAREDGADIVADDQLIFDDADPARVGRLLGRGRSRAPTWLTLEAFLLETRLFGRAPNLGYLKPVIRLTPWRASGVRYDEAMPIGEDRDLLLRLLTAGLKCRIDPSPGYFYRKHCGSTSHRLSAAALDQLARADAGHRAGLDPSPRLARAMRRYSASIETARVFTQAVEALKAGRPGPAVRAALRRPQAAMLFRMPLLAAARRWRRRLVPARRAPPAGQNVWFITRQRLVGRTNGSSIYLLELAEAVRRAGFEPHLLQPSPGVVGRWPVLRLRPEMQVFASISWRGLTPVGTLVFARDPRVWLAAARAIAARGLQAIGLPFAWLKAEPAPFSAAAPWRGEDALHVARSIRRRPGLLIADYAWQTDALPYALDVRARTAVIMHDLFHRRVQSDAPASTAPVLSRDDEARLLGRADAIIAIQKTEAEEIARLLPEHCVLVIPKAADPAHAPQPGDSRRILFVGSNAEANVEGMAWMIEQAWPAIREALPDVELLVAGSVSRARLPPAEGVRYLGFVDRLDQLYAGAGVVISPLISGSGLKIKLIEAMAHGKACVATSVTLQGIEEEARDAVALADSPRAFAAAVIELLADEPRRIVLGERALGVIGSNFCAERLHAGFTRWLAESAGARLDRPRSATRRLAGPERWTPGAADRPAASRAAASMHPRLVDHPADAAVEAHRSSR